ncbi:MAG: substrate-binding domain-containing protein [Acidobacteriia bacterium]|nr:substrate-binding domain-containing protein [Terriglobia bacterium]
MIHRRNSRSKQNCITLKSVAEHLGLSTGTISLVLNRAPQSSAIPQHTQDRIFAAARALNYQPNPVARALRTRRTSGDANRLKSTKNDSRALVFAGAKEFARAMHAIRQAGLRVPGDVSVVGFEDLLPAGSDHYSWAT